MYLHARSERVLHVWSCLNLWLVWAALEFLVGLCEGCYSSEQSGTAWRLEYVLVVMFFIFFKIHRDRASGIQFAIMSAESMGGNNRSHRTHRADKTADAGDPSANSADQNVRFSKITARVRFAGATGHEGGRTAENTNEWDVW
ncbi:hypothetical protein VTI28DRAFT_8081 [Corynascus sepedonium]